MDTLPDPNGCLSSSVTPKFSYRRCSGALRTGSVAFESTLWQHLDHLYIISGHAHKQLSCTKPLPQGICSTINLVWELFANKISLLFPRHYVLFQLAKLFIRGNIGFIFLKCWNWQICHTHQVFKLPLCTFSGKLQTFPTVKSKTIGSI